MRALFFVFLSLCLLASVSQANQVRVPGYTAYLAPNPEPEGMDVSPPAGVTGWADSKTKIIWYGELKTAGSLTLSLSLHLPTGGKGRWKLTVAGQSLTAEAVGGPDTLTVPFGSVTISKAGSYQFVLEGLTKTGPTFGGIDALLLDSPAALGAHFSQAETRGAPSVHLWYPVPKTAPVTWFYNEVTVKSSPLWSYFMACGFSRGYFGIQVNSPTERRIIFSVWDSGKEPTDRSKVADDDKVQLIAKGSDVYTDSFGHEGTGGHSHLVYPWKTGQTYQFLVSAKLDGTGTIYSGYFYFPDRNAWGLIARFRAPKDGEYLRGLYSFNEDFNGANGDQRRLAEFGPQWIKTTDGPWVELRTARFTHTADGVKERVDRAGGLVHDRFFLANGGFLPTESVKYGDTFTRPASHHSPPEIALLPND